MLSRNRPVHARLKLAFGLFVGTLLLIFWLAGVVYYFVEEQQDSLESARAQAGMIATQSSAAVVFEDHVLLAAQLSVLKQMKDVRWALIAAPDAAGASAGSVHVIAQYGPTPPELEQVRRDLVVSPRWDAGFASFRLIEPIVHDGLTRAELIMEIDFERRLWHFLGRALASLGLGLFLLWLGSRVFERILSTVSGPIAELVGLVDRVTAVGIARDRADGRARDEVGQLSRAFNQMLDVLAAREADVARSRDELRALAGRLQQIREEERTRISHEIHDELGQRMTAIKYEVARLTEGKVREQLSAMIDEAIDVVRSISWELRPSLLDSLGLLAAIEWLAHDFQQRTGITCALSLPKEIAALDPACSTALFRICQELLTNVARHARAGRVDLHLANERRGLVLEVEDDGIGFDAERARLGVKSLGLLGVRERAMRWGGHIEITSADTKGSCIRIYLPANAAGGKGEQRT